MVKLFKTAAFPSWCAAALLSGLLLAACEDDDVPGRDAARPDAGDAGPADGVSDRVSGDGLEAGSDGAAGSEGGSTVAVRPEKRAFSPALVAGLKTPTGFKVDVLASGLGNPRWLAVGPGGDTYVTLRAEGQVLRLRDGNNDGDAEDPGERTVVASAMDNPALDGVHGITFHQGKVYLASIKSVVSATVGSDGGFTGFATLVSDLPDGGQHPNRTLAVGPDNKLYVTVGSTCDACAETNSEAATVLRLELTGAASANDASPNHPMLARDPKAKISPRVFASGLRNTLGFDWHPVTKALWGSDHGSDGRGNDLPPDEVNLITGGKSFGWPYCYAAQQPDPIIDEPSEMMKKLQYCPKTESSAANYQAHSAPIGFVFYSGSQFPAPYRNDAFVAFRGSWNRDMPTGYKVVRLHFGADGKPAALPGGGQYEDFLTGFLLPGGREHFGRIAGLAVDPAGALLVAEDTNGVIYRVSYPAGAGDGGVDGGGADADGGGSEASNPDAGADADDASAG